MCGIVYSKNFNGKPVNKTIAKRYTAQRSRGYNGFGFYVPETNRLTHNAIEGRILSLLRKQREATEILFHHRFPTSTANVRSACHPFSTKDTFENNYVLVHNGVLRNDNVLKEQHAKEGITYVSLQENGRFNDSEALTYDVARYLEGKVDKLTAAGSIAFICIKRDVAGKPIALFFGRNSGNPLKMKRTKHSLTLSSEGEGDDIDANQLYCFTYETKELTKTPLVIPFQTYYSTTYSTPKSWERDTNYHSSSCRDTDYTGRTVGGGTATAPVVVPIKKDDADVDNTHSVYSDYLDDEYDDFDQEMIKEQAEFYITENGGDLDDAIVECSMELGKLQSAYQKLDDMARDEEKEVEITEELIEKANDLEERIELLRATKSWIIKEANRREGVGSKSPVGFQTPAAKSPESKGGFRK